MSPHWLTAIVAGIVLLGLIAGPAAAQPAGNADECVNADRGPGENGPPGFVGGLLPDFLGDLFSDLPVPNFVKAWFGAETC